MKRFACVSGWMLLVVAGAEAESALRPAPGRPLLVHLWASWCRSCYELFPALESVVKPTMPRLGLAKLKRVAIIEL